MFVIKAALIQLFRRKLRSLVVLVVSLLMTDYSRMPPPAFRITSTLPAPYIPLFIYYVQGLCHSGQSGSGKTTMLSLLAGLDLPSEGQVIFSDTATSNMNRDKYRREDVSVIYQAYNLFPQLTALENVMYPQELKGIKGKEARTRAAETIKSVGLTENVYKRFPVIARASRNHNPSQLLLIQILLKTFWVRKK